MHKDPMSPSLRLARIAAIAAAAALVPHFLSVDAPARAAGGYPEPRFPKYLRTVTSVEPLMDSARLAARQIAGRTPLGLVKSGEDLVIAVPDEQDALVLEAITRAMKERGV